MKTLPIQKENKIQKESVSLIYSSHYFSNNLKVSVLKATILIDLCLVR